MEMAKVLIIIYWLENEDIVGTKDKVAVLREGVREIGFIKMLKISGPRMEPCGTPEVTGVRVETLPSRATRWDRDVR